MFNQQSFPFLLLMLAAAAVIVCVDASTTTALSDAEWDDAKRILNVHFATSHEDHHRREILARNLQRAADLQKQNPHATFGLSPLALLTPEEFQRRYANSEPHIQRGLELYKRGALRHIRPYVPRTKQTVTAIELPTSIDWRQKGAVTPVKNQGDCGSCWSFSTTGSIEGQWFLSGRDLVSLSEQNFVSCDDLFAFGCDGSFSWLAYSWAVDAQNGTIYLESSYPYVSGENGTVPSCNRGGAVAGAQIVGGQVLSPWNALGMRTFLASEGPLSVAVDATTFQTYTNGILTSCEDGLPDHEVLVVGYSEAVLNNQTVPYWIVKNSWGTTWGEAGYIRVASGKNLCQIELLPNTATVVAV